MPWKEVKPMDEKVLFIADWLRQNCSFTELCDRYTISRKTGYKWISRYNEGGVEELREASRRPHQSPQKIPYAIRKAILELRTRGTMVPGPKKIQVRFIEYRELPANTKVFLNLNPLNYDHFKFDLGPTKHPEFLPAARLR